MPEIVKICAPNIRYALDLGLASTRDLVQGLASVAFNAGVTLSGRVGHDLPQRLNVVRFRGWRCAGHALTAGANRFLNRFFG